MVSVGVVSVVTFGLLNVGVIGVIGVVNVGVVHFSKKNFGLYGEDVELIKKPKGILK